MQSPSPPARWSAGVSLIPLTGADALRFLHGQSSQAIASARPGDCLATCLISPTARMRGLALVLVRPQAVDLLVLAGEPGAIHQALDRVLFPADQVALGTPEPATLVRWFGDVAIRAGEGELLRPGVDLGAGPDQPALLLRPGEPLPGWLAALPELAPEQVERQRIRQGFPATGTPATATTPAASGQESATGGQIPGGEIHDGTNPFELGLARWVSLSKGCYVGQETLAKLATYDGVKQQLRHWQLRHWPLRADPAAAGLQVGAGLTTPEGERAGVITSMIQGPDGPEGLALVRRAALGHATLLAGGTGISTGLELSIRTPAAFVAPPVGAGAQA